MDKSLLLYSAVFAVSRVGCVSLFLLAVFVFFLAGQSIAYSQCSTSPPAAPTALIAASGSPATTTETTSNVTESTTECDQVATPTITPNGGSFSSSVTVSLATATSEASIYYTTDGSTPTQSSKLYSGAMTLTSSTVLKAKAFKSGYNPSAEASASFAVAASTTQPTGNVYYVATNGSDSYSCSQARNMSTPKRNIMGASGGISCLSAGTTLDIREGIYNESIISYGTPMLPNGTSWDNAVTIRGHAGETVQIRQIGFASGSNRRYFIFDNLVISGGNDTGVYLGSETDHIRVTNSEIKLATNMGVAGFCQFCEFINVSIHDNGTAGIAHGGYGIYWGGADTLFERIQVYNNPGYGIHIFLVNGTTVSRNIVRYSRIFNNGGSESGQKGVLLSSGTGNMLLNSIVYGNTKGVAVDYRCLSCVVANNTIYDNNKNASFGLQPFQGVMVAQSLDTVTSGTIIKNNIIYGHAYSGVYNKGFSSIIDRNHCDSAAAGCVSTGDPLFVDPATGDFSLKSGSRAIDRGDLLNDVPAYDIEGISRPRGLRWDIGAHESW